MTVSCPAPVVTMTAQALHQRLRDHTGKEGTSLKFIRERNDDFPVKFHLREMSKKPQDDEINNVTA